MGRAASGMADSGKNLVLWNPASGSSEKALAAQSLLADHRDYSIVETSSREEAVDLATEAATQGIKIVVAAGGDGTVNAVAQGLLNAASETALGILPTGTGNDLARSLAIPLDPVIAAQTLLAESVPTVRRIDAVDLRTPTQQTTYVNMATGGNSGRFTQQLTDDMKQFWGALCYLRGTLNVISDLTVFDLSVCVDNEPMESFSALNVFVANGRTSGGGLQAAPHASLEDGLLEVIIVLDGGPIDLAAMAAKHVVGSYLESELVIQRRGETVSIESEPAMVFSADGDVVTEEPVVFSVRHAALPVVVGPDYFESPPDGNFSANNV